MVVCESSQKSLILFHLVHGLGVKNALVFTKSAESTTRLVKLFEFFEESRATRHGSQIFLQAYSSDLSPSARKDILDKFKNQEIHMWVTYSDEVRRAR